MASDSSLEEDRRRRRRRRKQRAREDAGSSLSSGSDDINSYKKQRHRKDRKHKKKKRHKKRSRRDYSSSNDEGSSERSRRRRKRRNKHHPKRKRGPKEQQPEKDSEESSQVILPTMNGVENGVAMAAAKKLSNPKSHHSGSNDDMEAKSARAKSMAPMSREQYEAQQSVIREVYDEETGRMRLVRGTGEIIERIVSRNDHERINQQATRGDGSSYSRHIFSATQGRK